MSRAGLMWVAIAAVVFVGGCSNTGRDTQPPEQPAVGTGGAGASVKSDGEFVQDVAMKNLAAIELSRIALTKAASPDIKSFAQQMIDDHVTAERSLKSAVSGHPISWPPQLDDKHRQLADELAAKQGTDFDRDYVEAMVEGHQDLAGKLESRLDVQSLADWKTAVAGRSQSKAMPDPKTEMSDVVVRPNKSDSEVTMKINQWAADTYPVAQKYLDAARTLENAAKKKSTS